MSDAATQDGMYQLKKGGKVLFTGTENECYMKLQRIQSQSADWAMKYEGYTIKPIEENEGQ